jgi:hypothetical protein
VTAAAAGVKHRTIDEDMLELIAVVCCFLLPRMLSLVVCTWQWQQQQQQQQHGSRTAQKIKSG